MCVCTVLGTFSWNGLAYFFPNARSDVDEGHLWLSQWKIPFCFWHFCLFNLNVWNLPSHTLTCPSLHNCGGFRECFSSRHRTMPRSSCTARVGWTLQITTHTVRAKISRLFGRKTAHDYTLGLKIGQNLSARSRSGLSYLTKKRCLENFLKNPNVLRLNFNLHQTRIDTGLLATWQFFSFKNLTLRLSIEI